jgi:hypothetical protein
LRAIDCLLTSFLYGFLTACYVAVLQPLETMTGLLTQPGFTGKQPLHTEALAKVRRLRAWLAQQMYLPAQYAAWLVLQSLLQLQEWCKRLLLHRIFSH